MTIDEKATTNSGSSAPATSEALKATSVMKPSDAVRSDTSNIQVIPSIASKPDCDVSAKSTVEVKQLVKSENVINALQPGKHAGQSQLEVQSDNQVNIQHVDQFKSPLSTQLKPEVQAPFGESQTLSKEKTLNASLVKTALQDTLKARAAEKPRIPGQGSVHLPSDAVKPKTQPSQLKDTNHQDQVNLNVTNQSLQAQPMHNQSVSSGFPRDFSPLEPQDASQSQHVDEVKRLLDDDESSLRELLGLADVGVDQSHVQSRSHIQNKTLIQPKVNAQLQGPHAHPGQHVQNMQHTPVHVQPPVAQGKGRAPILTQSQPRPSVYRQSQQESQNRIQSQLNVLTHPQRQVGGELQGKFNPPPREDKSHPLSQSKSPNSPRALTPHTTSPQRMLQASFNSQINSINKPKTAEKTILDFFDEVSPPRNSQGFHSSENRPLSHVTSAPSSLSSCSFQNVSREHQITPPRNIKTPPNSMSPPLSSPNRHPIRNVSPIRQMSNNTGTFGNISPQKRLSSCSLQNIPSKLNQERPASPCSPRQGYNYITKMPSAPNLSCQFTMQPSRSSPENHQRTSHMNTLASNYMALSSSDKHNSQLAATTLLNSLAK